MKQVITILLLLISTQLLGQEKIEREQRIKTKEVPAEAREWMKDAFEKVRKVKWYLEETSGKRSYEAKFSWDGQDYSVEFDTMGVIEDIEMKMEWEALPEGVSVNLEEFFLSEYQKYNIRKIQRQWTAEPDDLEDAIDEEEVEEVTTRYEIEFYGKSEEGKSLWEGLFDDDGKLISKREVILRPADNLNY